MNQASILKQAISRMLKPLVRILLQHGMPVNEFMELVKKAYVEVADAEFQLEGRKQSVSRISVLTGMHRKDVTRLRNQSDQQIQDDQEPFHNRAARVMSAWTCESDYVDSAGEPRVLPINGDTPSFSALVMQHSGSMTVRAMLDEMLRVKVVELQPDNMVKLVQRAYVPQNSDSQRLVYMGDAGHDLFNTLAINIDDPAANRLQLTTAFDNLPEECLPELKAFCHQQSIDLLKKLERWLAEHDRDCNPKVRGSGRYRAGLGIYYIEEPVDD